MSPNSKLPKYVYKQEIKGKTYYRFRRKGGGSVRLPGGPNTPEFHSAYAKLIADPERDVGRYTSGSVAHTIDLFYKSADFTTLAPGTQRDYRRYLNRFDRAVGGRELRLIDSEWMYALRDKLRETPSAANHALAVLRTLFQFAIKRKSVTNVISDPTQGIEKLGGGESYRRWEEEEIVRFLESDASLMMKLALLIGVFTGQRLGDVIRMAWPNYDGKSVKLRQQKTKTFLTIPVHPDLKEALDEHFQSARALVILTSKTGRAMHPRVFSRDFRNARIKAGLPDDLSFHGLRHTAASYLAELGAPSSEIQAITGHKSLKQVETYIKQASQSVQAANAVARLPTRKKC